MTRVDVIGAGVVGTIYASRLAQAGHDVRLVARGERLTQLADGAAIHDTVTGERIVQALDVASSPRADSEIVLLAVGAHQLDGVAARVPDNGCPVVLLGNGIVGATARIAPERAVVGFTGAGGTMRHGEVQCYDTDRNGQCPVTIDGTHVHASTIAGLLRSADVPVDLVDDMDSWRMTHHAVVVAMAGALDLAGGDAWRLAHTPDIQRVLSRAVKESFTAITRSGHFLTPAHLARLGRIPEPLLRLAIRQMFTSDFGIRRFEAHYAHARAEWPILAAQLEQLLDSAGVAAPSARLLCARLQTIKPSLIVGANDLPTDRTAAFAVTTAAVLALWWRRRR